MGLASQDCEQFVDAFLRCASLLCDTDKIRSMSDSKKQKIILLYAFEKYWGKKPRAPLSLMYLAETLREEFEPVIVDTRLVDDLANELTSQIDEALFVGMSVMIGNQVRFSLGAAALIRRIAPKTPIVWGGTFATMAAKQCVEDERIDIVVKGDGEISVLLLARALANGEALDNVPHIAFMKGGEYVETNEGVPALPSLTNAVMPAWDLVDPSHYKQFEVVASKGCAFSCTYCYVHAMHGGRWRRRSPVEIVDEIELLCSRYGAEEIQFVDDNFFQKRNHVRRIAELLIERNIHITWESTCRANDLATFDDDFFLLIYRSGCREVFVGAETGSEAQLKRIDKRIAVSLTEKACERSERFGIKVKLLWMIGLIGETEEDRMATAALIDDLIERYPETVKISSYGIYTPYPGTPQTVEALSLGHRHPSALEDWGDYYHDNAQHGFLDLRDRRHLENMMWIQRYAHGRNRTKTWHRVSSRQPAACRCTPALAQALVFIRTGMAGNAASI